MCVGLNTYHARLQNPMSPVGKHLRNHEATEAQQCKCKVCPESIHPGEVRNFLLPCDLCAYFASTLAIHFFSVGEAAEAQFGTARCNWDGFSWLKSSHIHMFLPFCCVCPQIWYIRLANSLKWFAGLSAPKCFLFLVVMCSQGWKDNRRGLAILRIGIPKFLKSFWILSRCVHPCFFHPWSLLLGSHQQVVVIGWEFTWQRAMVEEDWLSFVAQCSRSGAAQPDPLWHLTMRSMFVVCSFAEPCF